MVEPTGHCPYLGLKQNRAIRFASPTPEHRCYVSGEPIEIPVDQSSYCLSQGHVHCPLYMGLSMPTTSDTTTRVEGMAAVSAGGLRGWLSTLSPRDRAIYASMLGMLALIVAIYLFAGLQTIFGRTSGVSATTATPAPATLAPTEVPTAPPTAIPPTPTNLPTSTPSPRPTTEPTKAPVIIVPTVPPTLAPTVPPTLAPTVPPTLAPTSAAAPTKAPAGQPTQQRPPIPPTSAPSPRPTQAPVISTQRITLYFADASGSLYVPVQRNTQIENNQVAHAAVRELIAGPRGGLGRLVLPDAQLLELRIDNETAVVNFDRRPTGAGDDRGFHAIVLTLTEFPSITRVQFQINGRNTGVSGNNAPVARPVVNPLNPQGLPIDYSKTSFLPLYFPANDGAHDIRVIRMVAKTTQVAEGTVRAILEGPLDYSDRVQRVIPAGVELRGIQLSQGILTVDFSEPFATAANRAAAVRTIVESLTTFDTIKGVRFQVEGQSLSERWGAEYGETFRKPVINAE